MLALARHRLVWPAPPAWAALLAQSTGDATAHAVVRHWAAHHLPLVVGRQPDGLPAHEVAFGLPAPLRWGRRRLGLRLAESQLSHSGAFPTLAQVARRFPWRREGAALASRLAALGTRPQVFGSHGWQVLSGLPCLREGSDLDLLIAVESLDQAGAVVDALAAAALPCRIDGELVFGDDHAVAWREFARWREGAVQQVLCKRLRGVELLDGAALRAVAAPSPHDERCAA